MEETQRISLIEVLFFIAIAIVILVSVFRYFGMSSSSIRVARAIRQVHTLTKLSYQWLDSQNQDDFSHLNGGQSISMQQLVKKGFIKKASQTKDPWQGNIIIQPGSDPKRIQITLTKVPKNDCIILSKHLDKNSKITMPNCSRKFNNYTGEF